MGPRLFLLTPKNTSILSAGFEKLILPVTACVLSELRRHAESIAAQEGTRPPVHGAASRHHLLAKPKPAGQPASTYELLGGTLISGGCSGACCWARGLWCFISCMELWNFRKMRGFSCFSLSTAWPVAQSACGLGCGGVELVCDEMTGFYSWI